MASSLVKAGYLTVPDRDWFAQMENGPVCHLEIIRDGPIIVICHSCGRCIHEGTEKQVTVDDREAAQTVINQHVVEVLRSRIEH